MAGEKDIIVINEQRPSTALARDTLEAALGGLVPRLDLPLSDLQSRGLCVTQLDSVPIIVDEQHPLVRDGFEPWQPMADYPIMYPRQRNPSAYLKVLFNGEQFMSVLVNPENRWLTAQMSPDQVHGLLSMIIAADALGHLMPDPRALLEVRHEQAASFMDMAFAMIRSGHEHQERILQAIERGGLADLFYDSQGSGSFGAEFTPGGEVRSLTAQRSVHSTANRHKMPSGFNADEGLDLLYVDGREEIDAEFTIPIGPINQNDGRPDANGTIQTHGKGGIVFGHIYYSHGESIIQVKRNSRFHR